MALTIRPDCRYFTGWKPCQMGECGSCSGYTPARPRVLIVKLGAAGDVVRTTCLLRRLRAEHPEAHITWVVDSDNAELLANNPLLDRVLPMSGVLPLLLDAETFDLALGLEHDPIGAALVTQCHADSKRGLLLSPEGKPVPTDVCAEYWYGLGLCDALRFRHNRKTYQQFMFEACGYTFCGERHVLQLMDEERGLALKVWRDHSLPQPSVGINLGGSPRFAGRRWPDHHVLELVRSLQSRELGVVLLAGVAEQERAQRLAAECSGAVAPWPQSKRLLAAVIEALAVLISSDTLALHLAMAVGTPAVALFGGTPWHEFESYGLADKLTAELPCSPCCRAQCEGQECMVAISPKKVLAAIEGMLNVTSSASEAISC